jgi:ribonuclease HI
MSSESEVFVGYADGASRHTRRLASADWVIFTPQGQLLSSEGICLGDTINNVSKYSVVIEFLCDALSLGISHLRVYLDAQLVVSQLNRIYLLGPHIVLFFPIPFAIIIPWITCI